MSRVFNSSGHRDIRNTRLTVYHTVHFDFQMATLWCVLKCVIKNKGVSSTIKKKKISSTRNFHNVLVIAGSLWTNRTLYNVRSAVDKISKSSPKTYENLANSRNTLATYRTASLLYVNPMNVILYTIFFFWKGTSHIIVKTNQKTTVIDYLRLRARTVYEHGNFHDKRPGE